MSIVNYFNNFRDDPEPLTSLQKRLLWTVALLVAASRLPAFSKSMWEWDEGLFALAMRSYDVINHQPHPPGYPLYIAAARLVRPLVQGSDFRALQVITGLGAITLQPALFFFAREARFPFRTALLGSVLTAFAPTVWYYGGTAFTDVPAVTLVILACGLLLRGCRHQGSYLAGAIVLGMAASFRPQCLLMGAVPGIIATIHRWRARKRDVIGGAVLGAVTIVASYGGAALASGSVEGYFKILRTQREYVMKVDSFRNPHRIPLGELAPGYFYVPTRGGTTAKGVFVLMLAGSLAAVFNRRWHSIVIVLVFLPFAIFAWLMLDPAAGPRYAVGYVPLYGMLAAEGAAILGMVAARFWRPAGPWIEPALVLGLTALFVVRMLPVLREVRRNPSPPVQAMEWILKNVDPKISRVVVFEGLTPFSAYYLHGWPVTATDEPEGPPVSAGWGLDDYFAGDGETRAIGAHVFRREKGRIFEISRQRYFDTYVVRLQNRIMFESGWHGAEEGGGRLWRWMAARSETVLPPMTPPARLALEFYLPLDSLRQPPTVTIRVNGTAVDSWVATEAYVRKSWVVPAARADETNVLVIETSAAANPARQGLGSDSRDLGLRLDAIGWAADAPRR